jgi:hypothetical protein
MIETSVLFAYHAPMKMGRFTAGWLVIETCVFFAFGVFAEPAPQVVHGVSGVAVQTATINFSKVAGEGTKAASPRIASPASTTNFDAVDDNNTFTPPDTQGAVGPNHVMTTLNSEIAIRDRGGALVTPVVSFQQFWASLMTGIDTVYGPQLVYEPFDNRWIFSTADYPGGSAAGNLFIGVSQTSDPTGTWFLYKIPAAGSLYFDSPRLGFNKDWIVVTVNVFHNSSGVWQGVNLFVFNKANLYAHGSSLYTQFITTTAQSIFGPCPAQTFDNSLSTEYLAEDLAEDFSPKLRISTITGPVGSETLTLGVAFATNTPWAAQAPAVNFLPQEGTTAKIDAYDSRVSNCVYRNGHLWAAHTIFLPSNSPTRASVQWWQFAPNGVVRQVGRIDDPNGVLHFAFPSIAVNKEDGVLIGYSQFSTNQYVSANYSVRTSFDPLNTMRDSTVYKAGLASYNKTFSGTDNYWGDYSSTVVDPTDDQTLWTLQEYAASPANTWGTWWAEVRVPSLVAPTIISPRRASGTFTFSFQSANGQPYAVEYNTTLSAANWTALQTNMGDGSVQSVTNANSSAQRFFRLRSP